MNLVKLAERAEKELNRLQEKTGKAKSRLKKEFAKLQKSAGSIGFKTGGNTSFFLLKRYADLCVRAKDIDVAANSYRMAMKTASELKDKDKFLEVYKSFESNCPSSSNFADYQTEIKTEFEKTFGKNLEDYL